jgi:cytochrome c peroxidase
MRRRPVFPAIPAPGPRARRGVSALALASLLALAGCGGAVRERPAFEPPRPDPALRPGLGVPVPAAFPEPAVPVDNPYTRDKAELGRHLFYDRRLSATGAFACADCHQQRHAFTDARTTAVGATGELHRRNTMTLANVAYNGTFNWADAETRGLEDQMRVPMFSLAPIELGLSGHEAEALRSLVAEPRYPPLFAAAFPGEPAPIHMENVIRAIATFERSLASVDSPYDHYLRGGDRRALSPAARRGMTAFFSRRLRCSQCHRGVHLAGNTTWFGRPPTPFEFHNTGLYNLEGGAYPAVDRGRIEQSGRPEDMGRFRAPTLRNVALTAPYMHDGSIATLDGVLAHYSAGGRTVHDGPYRGVGRRNPFKSERVRRLRLSPAAVADLRAFLESLTDEAFVDDPRYGDPWRRSEVLGPSP